MYNAVTNGWENFEKQITFDVRQPKTHRYSMERLRKFIAANPHVDVIRYTTFFPSVYTDLRRAGERKICGLVRIFSFSEPLYSGTV